MLEGPKQADRDAQERAQEDARWSAAKEFFSNNPTFVVTLLYLYVTVVGMVYSAALYGRFGINIFDYSETADFLLAAFKNPVAFLSAGILAALSAAYALWTQRSVRSLIARYRVRGWAVQRAVGASEEEADEYVRQFEEEREIPA